MRISPPAQNQDYGSNVSPPPQDDAGAGGIATQDEGIAVDAAATTLNFVGQGVTASGGAGTTTVTVNGTFVPTYLSSSETFTVPAFRQAVFATNIDNEGFIVLDGFLIEVD